MGGANHGLHDVVALASRSRHSEQGGRSQDDDIVGFEARAPLSHRLGGTVDVDRRGGIVLPERTLPRRIATEHVIGADMNEPRSLGGADPAPALAPRVY